MRIYDVEMARPHLYITPTKLPYAVLTDKNGKVRHLRVGPTTILLWMQYFEHIKSNPGPTLFRDFHE